MCRASFLDRSPGARLASAFAIWIRWWLKRKLKRNSFSFSAAVPRLPLAINFPPSDSCLGVKPCNRSARTLPNECPSRKWSPHRHASNFAEDIDTGPFHAATCPRASIEAESGVVQALRRTRRFVSHRRKPRFTPIFSCPHRTNCTHSATADDDGFLVSPSLNPPHVRRRSKTNVD
jgi:hypothetical protein